MNALRDFLQSQKAGEKDNAAHAKARQSDRAQTKSKKESAKVEKKKQQQAKRDAAKVQQPAPSEITPPPPKRVDTRKQTWPQEEVALSQQIMQLRAKIREDGRNLHEMRRKLDRMQRERKAKQNGLGNEVTEKENTPQNNSNSTAEVVDIPKKIHYTFNGRAGIVKPDDSGVILFSELAENLEPLTPEMMGDANGIRSRRRIHLQRYGKSHAWAPAGTVLVGRDYLTKLKKSAEIVKNLKDLMDADKCVISREGLCRLAAWGLHNYGGSDESFQMSVAGTLDMLFHEIGFECSAEQLGKAVPSQRTIAQYELNLAVDCVMKTCQEIKDDGAKQVGLMCDHGHGGGQDHFVTVLVWSGYKDGKKTIKFVCPSIDSAGHSAKEAAEGVQSVVKRFLADDSIKVHCLLGDRGGGAAVQNLYPELVELGIMTDEDVEASCTIHGVQKSLENASKKTMGDQGLGSRTPFQMIYVFASLMKKLREMGGLGLTDTLGSSAERDQQ